MKKRMRIIIVAVAVLTFWWAVSATPVAMAQEKTALSISGAGLLSDVIEAYAEEFRKEAPNCPLTISGATSGIGFQRLIDGKVDLAMVARQITPEETKKAEAKGIALSSKFIGKIGLAIITNSKNTVNELTMDQLAAIFKGEITNWNQVGGPAEPIRVAVRAVPETGEGVLFQQIVLKGAPYAKDSVVMGSHNSTVSVCGKSYGIGYIPTTTVFFDRLGERGIKVIKIRKDSQSPPYQLYYDARPTAGVVKEMSYPISVDFLFYWNSKTTHPFVRRFVDSADKQTD